MTNDALKPLLTKYIQLLRDSNQREKAEQTEAIIGEYFNPTVINAIFESVVSDPVIESVPETVVDVPVEVVPVEAVPAVDVPVV